MNKPILHLLACLWLFPSALPAQTPSLTSPCLGTFSRKGFFFDLYANKQLTITGLSPMAQNCGTRNVKVYGKPGGYDGFQSNPGAWTLLDSAANFTPACANVCPIPPTLMPCDFGVCIPAGQTFAFYFNMTAGPGTFESHNTLPAGSTGAQNADLVLYTGGGQNTLTPFYDSSTWVSGLTFQGVIHYRFDSIFLGNDTVICQNTQLTLTPGPGYAVYQWSTGDTTPVLTVDTTGVYAVTVTAAGGCVFSDTIQVAEIICTGTGSTPAYSGGEGVVVAPSPMIANCTMFFLNPKNDAFTFSLYDMTGRLVETRETNGDRLEVEKAGKPPGIYLFSLVNEKTGVPLNGKIVVAE